MKALTELAVGDTVLRNMFGVKQELRVTKVDSLIHCGPWTFNARTGKEVDEDISVTVSTITSTTPQG